MGKGTIVHHLGEGQYRVRLNRSTARIDVALAGVATDLSVLQGQIKNAWQVLQDAETRLSAAIHDINAAIEAISDQIQELADAVREARELVDQGTDELRTAQESLDFLEQAKKDDRDSVTDEQIRIATEQRDAKQALLDAANDQLTSATDAWNSRDVEVQEQDSQIVAAAKLREEFSTARLAYNGLVLEKASLEKRKAWLESKRKADPELDAWCADLTEDINGEVGTIEISGERSSDTDPVIIRPGYEGRAVYQPLDPHQTLIDAKIAALTQSIQAQDRLDAAVSALDVEVSKRRELQGRLDNLLSQPERDQAEMVFLIGQIEASDALLPVLAARKATMDEALTAAQVVFDAASQSLTAARAADSNPRLPDGILQSIPASPGPFSSFFNQALLPAWQKWRPMYRVGTITELTGDRCTVVLDPATSSQQSIDVNWAGILSDVSIQYMDCDGQAFDVGDRVVVEFRNQDLKKPCVIGFESHPQGCGDHGIIGALAGDDAPSGYHRTKVGSTYYADYKTLRYKDGAWTLGAPPRGTGAATNGGRSFGQFDWVYRRDGKFRGYLTWGHPASHSNGLFFTWFRTQCPNRFGDYSWANILPITYDGRSSASAGSVFLNGKLLAKPAGLLGNRSVAGAALRHVNPAPTADNPNPTERRYVLMVIDQSVIAAGDDNRYGPTMTFGAALYAVDVTDGPVDTNAKWAAKARLIYEIGQLSLTKPSIGNSAYGGVDRFTTFGSRGVRFRFNGSATRASAVVHAQCELGYDRNGDARWHDWGEIPLVVHIDIADDLTCTHTVEDPVIGTYSFSGSRWQKKSTGWGTIPPGGQTPPPEIVGEAHYEGSGTVGTTTLMIDYVGDVEKRVTATDRCDYHCHQTFIAWANSVFDIALDHEIAIKIGRHTVTERRLDRRPLGDIGSTESVFVNIGVAHPYAAFCTGALVGECSLTGFSQTSPMGCQLRVAPDQRLGCCVRAA
jgi:hypothetical protein